MDDTETKNDPDWLLHSAAELLAPSANTPPEAATVIADLAGEVERARTLLASMQSELDGANGRVVEVETELSAVELTASRSERVRLAELFESSRESFPDGLSIEVLVFMLRLGT